MLHVIMDQGLNGIVSIVEIDQVKYVKKESRNVDVSIELEVLILNKLETLNSPHFPKLFKYELDSDNPTLYMEFIEGDMLCEYYDDDDKIKDSLNGITLTAASIMYEKLGIVHNDLHGANVMLRSTNVDIDRYVFKDGRVLEFKTYGYEPVIIDFGLANSNDSKMTITTAFTDIGIFPFELDSLADARRLCPHEFAEEWITESGWFKPGTFKDFSEEIYMALGTNYDNRELIDLCTSRINLPLIKSKININPKKAFILFCKVTKDIKINEKLNSNTKRLLFFKITLERNSKYILKKYSDLFTLTEIKKLKSILKYVIMSINDIVYKLSKKAIAKKRKLYSNCIYNTTRDLAESLSLTTNISSSNGKYLIRTYDVETATISYEIN